MKQSEQYSKAIKEHKYTAYRWIEFRDFSDDEVAAIELAWADIPQLDGFDVEGKTCCFKFNHYKPVFKEQVSKCKEKNEKLAYSRMVGLSKTVSKYGYYFNPSKLFFSKKK